MGQKVHRHTHNAHAHTQVLTQVRVKNAENLLQT